MDKMQRHSTKTGALDGGSPMSHVDVKKWQCCMSLHFPQCHTSNLREGYAPCHYIVGPHVACH